ncbi:MAG: hypothetical protein ACKOGA_20350 [Planctomycetaceae bacterium]
MPRSRLFPGLLTLVPHTRAALPVFAGILALALGLELVSVQPPLRAQTAPPSAESLEQLLKSLEEELDWDASALFPPDAGGAGTLSATARKTYSDAACAALAAGLRKDRAPSTSELKQARDSLRQASALCGDDPRILYSSGLISLAASDWATAHQQFTDAADLTDLPHPGALAGSLFAHLSRPDPAAAAEACHDLAETLASADADWPSPALSRALAEWLGRAVACASPAHPARSTKPTAPTDQANPAAALRAEIAATLPTPLQSPFERGFTAVDQRRSRLLAWAQLSPEQLRTETAAARGKIEEQLEQLRSAEQRLIDRRKQLEGPHAEAVQQLTQQLRQQVTRLQAAASESRGIMAQIERLNNAGKVASNNARRGATRGRRGASGRSGRNNNGKNNSATNDRERQQKIKELRDKLKDNNDRISKLQRDVEKSRDQRRGLDAEHSDELKQVKRELDTARRRRQQAEEELLDLKTALSNPGELRQRADSPATWLPLNLLEQRDALSRAFRQTAAE